MQDDFVALGPPACSVPTLKLSWPLTSNPEAAARHNCTGSVASHLIMPRPCPHTPSVLSYCSITHDTKWCTYLLIGASGPVCPPLRIKYGTRIHGSQYPWLILKKKNYLISLYGNSRVTQLHHKFHRNHGKP